MARHGPVWVVADLRSGHDGEPFIEQLGERTQDAALGLPTFPEQDDVVSGQKRVLELGQDGVVEAEHALDERATFGYAGGRVSSNLFVDGNTLPARSS
jgi:hypothetical protein